MCKAPSRAIQRPFGGSALKLTLIRWDSSPVTGNPHCRMSNPNSREGEELVIADFVYAADTGKPWSDIADIAYRTQIANFVFAVGTCKPRSNIADIANIPNIGAVNPINGT
jgi:hypothetical protein